MARPAALPPGAEPRPALLSPHPPRAIRDALVGSERAEFEHDYQQAMIEAARTLDLTEVLRVLDVYRELAEITQWQGAEAHCGCWRRSPASSAGRTCPWLQGTCTRRRSARGWAADRVYSYDILSEAREYVDGMPAAALSSYSELIGFMEVTPWDASPCRQDKPDGNMCKMLFGRDTEGIALYLILEDQRRVVVVSVTWVG